MQCITIPCNVPPQELLKPRADANLSFGFMTVVFWYAARSNPFDAGNGFKVSIRTGLFSGFRQFFTRFIQPAFITRSAPAFRRLQAAGFPHYFIQRTHAAAPLVRLWRKAFVTIVGLTFFLTRII